MVEYNLDSLYTKEQAEEITRVWKSHPAKGRTPYSLAGKVRALRNRGINIQAPPFAHGSMDLAQIIISGNTQSQAHTDWRNKQISKSLLKADMTAGQTASAVSKAAKSKAIILEYKSAHGLPRDIQPSASQVADWFIKIGFALKSDRRNLIRRLRATELVT